MKTFKTFSLTLILFLILTPTVKAQNIDVIKSFENERNQINKTGMIVLGSWAVGNILLGAYGNYKSTGQIKYFHQFNAMWNIVNLGIAAYGYYNSGGDSSEEMSNAQIINEYYSLQSFLLLNAGLDIAYIVTGFYLKEKSKTSSKSELLRGYGNSLILQGGFLLVFDAVLYMVNKNHASINLFPHLESMLSGGIGMGVNINF